MPKADTDAKHVHRGYLRVYRSVFDDSDSFWAEERERTRWEAWIWILSQTHWDTTPGALKVRGEEIVIYRGEVYLSRVRLANAMRWKVSKARSFLDTLRARISARITARICDTDRVAYGIYKVINYDTYNPICGPTVEDIVDKVSQRFNPDNNHLPRTQEVNLPRQPYGAGGGEDSESEDDLRPL